MKNVIKGDESKLDSELLRNSLTRCPVCFNETIRSSRGIPPEYMCKEGHLWMVENGQKFELTEELE